ncbi:MAG: DUF4097 family beta strand repeat-containing protein [Eubacteriales bacterium]
MMKHSTKIALITGLISIAAGLLLLFCTSAIVGFDFRRLSTETFEKQETVITEPFQNIDISAVESDVTIIKSDTASVICYDSEGIVTEVTVENGTLTIARKDKRPWYEHITVSFWEGNRGMTVYLPENKYDSMNIHTLSGSIAIDESISAQNIDLKTTSGEIRASVSAEKDVHVVSTSGSVTLRESSAKTLTASAVSGDVYLDSCTVKGMLHAETTSGALRLSHCRAEELQLKTTSGETEISDVLLQASASIKSVSGEIEFEAFDAQTIEIKSTSGDVGGSFLTGKVYHTKTTSGNVRVPDEDPSGGICTVTTTSGNIRIQET